MFKRIIISLFLIQFIFLNCFPQKNALTDSLLREEVAGSGQARVMIHNPGSRMLDEIYLNLSVSSVRDKSVIIVISPLTIDWFINRNFSYSILPQTESKGVQMAEDVTQAMSWDTYPTYSQYFTIMKDFELNYPGLCNLDTIGTSINGKYILVLKISDNPGTDEDEPETFYSSTIHGDETGGYILMLHLADYLLQNYSTSSRVKNLVDNLSIWINPLANPDGTYRTGDVISSPTRYNANGYDLNRNFPDPVTPNTVKQKETLDMVKFLRKHNFVISANFHSGEEVVNYPWDRWSRLHPDNDWFYQISRKYADTVHRNAPSTYMSFLENGVTNGYDWYTIYGGRQDFVTWERQGREVTIELDNTFVTPAANLLLLWNYNWKSLLGYLENALYGIHGIVRDKITSHPVPAKIFITGHDADSSHVYSDTLTGSFVRLLYPGTWNLVFSADGYFDATVSNIVVTDGQKTEIVVEMIPRSNPVDTVTTADLLLYPDPADQFIKVVLPERQYGNVNVSVYNSMGQKLIDFNTLTIEDVALNLDTGKLAPGGYTIVITNLNTGIPDKARFIVFH